ncbi:hypothetical protein MXB_1404, partial [Myxobolus squamalis]
MHNSMIVAQLAEYSAFIYSSNFSEFIIEYICSFISNKLKILKARNRIYSLPVRKCTESGCIVYLNLADINEACPICFDNYIIGVKLCVLKCHHEYHQFCLVKWSGETCPLCRDPLFSDK